MQLHEELQSLANKHLSKEQLHDISLVNFLTAVNCSFIKKENEIKQYNKNENELAKTNQLLNTLFSKLHTGIVAEDENRKIVFTNQRWMSG